MSERTIIRLFRVDSATSFRGAVQSATQSFGGILTWGRIGDGNSDLRIGTGNNVHSIYIQYQDLSFAFCHAIGSILNCPWAELRIQEGAIWDCTLYRGAESVDSFSVAPEYWVEPENLTAEYLEEWRGSPLVWAQAFKVPIEAIERYLVHWGLYQVDEWTCDIRLKGKAYSSDEYEYGDTSQMSDFLRALGGEFPSEHHSILLPERGTALVWPE